MIVWTPHLPAALLAGLIIGAGLGLWWLHRRLAARAGRRTAWLLTAPRLLVALLLALAVLDPRLPGPADGGAPRALWLLVDASASMAVADAPGGSRRRRAEAIVDRLAAGLPGGVRVERRWFDTALHEVPPAGDGGTDLAACLQSLARPLAAGDALGVVVVSDGGDEAVDPALVPALPIAAVAVGGEVAQADNLVLAACTGPEVLERGVAGTLTVEAEAHGSPRFRAGCGAVAVTLERRRGDGSWQAAGGAVLDLRQGRAQASLTLREEQAGALLLRATLAAQAGELSTLDNRRELPIEVRERALHVLLWTRSLGVEAKLLRGELGRDPGITLTAAFRTVGERFVLQGDRVAGDEALAGGLPERAAGLAGFDVVVLGSFPAEALRPAARAALAAWVEGGGALVLLGGEASFARGGWEQGELAPLLPWQCAAGEPPPERGAFPLALAPGAAGQPIVQGLEGLIAGAAVASRNRPGPLRAGAQPLLLAGGEVLAAWQRYGRGRVLGIASDSLWRIDRPGRSPYGLFWRQAVRFLAERAEGSRRLRVSFDRPRYRPGDTALVEVAVAVEDAERPLRLAAALAAPDGSRRALAVEDGRDGRRTLSLPFTVRGTWGLRLAAHDDHGEVEVWERVLTVAPLLPEGARLGRDDEGLGRLAAARQGVRADERDLAPVQGWIADLARARQGTVLRSLVYDRPWWFAALLAVLLAEWWLRRRRGMV